MDRHTILRLALTNEGVGVTPRIYKDTGVMQNSNQEKKLNHSK